MRLRNIKGSKEMIAQSSYAMQEEEARSTDWREIFGSGHPIHIEIGMGKGRFLIALAKANPVVDYVGIEKYSSVLFRAIQKMEQEEKPLANLRFVRMEAENLTEVFGKGQVDRIYLNFSDPWPKDRHAKRRLTSREFFGRYSQILSPGGRVEFKTDNRPLFDFSVEAAEASGFQLEALTYDLHHDEKLSAGNVMTEYEERFSALGNPICKLIARR